MPSLGSLTFVQVAGGTFELGWPGDSVVDPQVLEGLDAFAPEGAWRSRISSRRTIELASFSIATETVAAEELIEDLDDDTVDAISGIDDLCNAIDRRLGKHNLRLASEDELEAALGGALFHWGNEYPGGVPYGDETRFQKHKQPTPTGVVVDPDTYAVELVRSAFKLGDGGEAVCGGYPWPVPWLSLASSFRLVGEMVEDLLMEFLEEARVRLVRAE